MNVEKMNIEVSEDSDIERSSSKATPGLQTT